MIQELTMLLLIQIPTIHLRTVCTLPFLCLAASRLSYLLCCCTAMCDGVGDRVLVPVMHGRKEQKMRGIRVLLVFFQREKRMKRIGGAVLMLTK